MDWRDIVIGSLTFVLVVVSAVCWHFHKDIRDIEAYFDECDLDLTAGRSTPAGGGPC